MKQKAKFDWGYEKVYEQHEYILKAIEAKDGPGAESALRAHLHSTGEKLVAAILESRETDAAKTSGQSSLKIS
jgi:GntR family transcriptional repressor for pyruvate dehydrogenase complex